MIDHPCFECELPDCDETDRACKLRRAISTYRKHGKAASPQVRSRSNIAYQELYGATRNARRKIDRDNKAKETAL